MVKNQIEFNEKCPKESKEIEIENKKSFEGQLIVEDYPELRELYLHSVKNIEKITLKNLTQLQECTIWDCGTQDLVIENCSQIKTLNIRSNSLTNLEFLKNLESLEELEIDGNAQLVEILRPYKNEWKDYQKDLQEIYELTKQNNFQGLVKKFWDLKKSREDLKKNVEKIHQKTINKEIDNTEQLVSDLEEEFKNKEEKVNYLEQRVWELTDLNKQQKEKIINAFLRLSPEKDLLQKLIKTHLEFTEFKKKEANSSDYEERCDGYEDNYRNVKKQLRTKLDKETMNSVQRMLDDCEKLVEQEMELEDKLSDKSSLIKNLVLRTIEGSKEKEKIEGYEKVHENQVQQSKAKRSNSVLLEIELAYNRGKSEAKDEEISRMDKHLERPNYQITNFVNQQISNTFVYQIQYSQYLVDQELIKLKQRYQTLEPTNEPASDPQKLKKTILFLGAKRIFATKRKDTIKSLVKTYEDSDESGKKYDKIALVGDYLDTVGDVASIFPPAGIPLKLLGKAIPIFINLLKDHSEDNYAKKFEDYLIKDEKSLTLLQETYQSLVSSLHSNQSSDLNFALIELFNLNQNPFSQYSAFIVGKIPKVNSSLDSESMKKAIELLDKHFKEFTEELQRETNHHAEKIEKAFFGADGEFLQAEVTELLEKLNGKEVNQESFLLQEKNQSVGQEKVFLKQQIEDKKTYLEKLVNSAKNRLMSKNQWISEQERDKKTRERESLLETLLKTQERIVYPRGSIIEESKFQLKHKLQSIKQDLSKKLTEEEVNNICRTQIELTKLQIDLEKFQVQVQVLPK
jgi:hypothetical protein